MSIEIKTNHFIVFYNKPFFLFLRYIQRMSYVWICVSGNNEFWGEFLIKS
jgi:hypothetical protein